MFNGSKLEFTKPGTYSRLGKINIKKIREKVLGVLLLLLIAVAVIWASLVILEGVKDGLIGVKNYVVSVVTNEPADRGLPEGIVENEVTADLCAQSLEDQYPGNWKTDDLRKCVDRNNGYSDLKGNLIHPFK